MELDSPRRITLKAVLILILLLASTPTSAAHFHAEAIVIPEHFVHVEQLTRERLSVLETFLALNDGDAPFDGRIYLMVDEAASTIRFAAEDDPSEPREGVLHFVDLAAANRSLAPGESLRFMAEYEVEGTGLRKPVLYETISLVLDAEPLRGWRAEGNPAPVGASVSVPRAEGTAPRNFAITFEERQRADLPTWVYVIVLAAALLGAAWAVDTIRKRRAEGAARGRRP